MARNWNAVAEAITTRLAELDMTQQDLAVRSGVSVATLRQLQRGIAKRRSARTLADVSQALRRPANFLSEVADGVAVDEHGTDEPTSERSQPAEDDLDGLRRTVAVLAERVDAIEQRLGPT